MHCVKRVNLPNARSTYEGSNDAEVHALPEDKAMSYERITPPCLSHHNNFAHL
jgi:hypothetical protein